MGNLPPMATQPARETRVLQYRVLLQPQHTHTETYSLLCKARPLNLTAPQTGGCVQRTGGSEGLYQGCLCTAGCYTGL